MSENERGPLRALERQVLESALQLPLSLATETANGFLCRKCFTANNITVKFVEIQGASFVRLECNVCGNGVLLLSEAEE